MEHETRFAGARDQIRGPASSACSPSACQAELGRELIGSIASATASSPSAPPTNCSPIARSSLSRWQGDAGIDFIEKFRLERSYRCVSINGGGSRWERFCPVNRVPTWASSHDRRVVLARFQRASGNPSAITPRPPVSRNIAASAGGPDGQPHKRTDGPSGCGCNESSLQRFSVGSSAPNGMEGSDKSGAARAGFHSRQELPPRGDRTTEQQKGTSGGGGGLARAPATVLEVLSTATLPLAWLPRVVRKRLEL